MLVTILSSLGGGHISINEAVRIVRERWRIVLAGVLLGLVGAGVAVAVLPRQYDADVPLYVSVAGRPESAEDAAQANELAKERVPSYAILMRDKRITSAVTDKLQLPMTPEQLAEHLTVAFDPDTVVMTVTATDTSPDRAAAIANAVAEEFVNLVAALEQPFGPTTAAPSPVPSPLPPPAPEPKRISPQIIRPAVASPIPVAPKIPFVPTLGAALGLLVGVGAAFLVNAGDRSVRDPQRLRVLTSAPVLAAIPVDRGVGKQPIAFDGPRESARAEAYRSLRTSLQFHRDAPRNSEAKVVVLTSAGIGEGTSLTACNLARALTAGSEVVLIDANFRHPQIEGYLGLDPGAGLSTVLTGNVGWPVARRRLSDVGLDVVPSGPSAPQLGELLTWHRMDELFRDLRTRYDYVIIDAPAVLAAADAAAVVARADSVILVVRHGATTEEEVTAAVEALRAVSAPLLGTVLSMVPAPGRRHRRPHAYPERPSSHLPPLLGSVVNPLVPPKSRIPIEPADVSTDARGDPPDRVDESRPDGAAR